MSFLANKKNPIANDSRSNNKNTFSSFFEIVRHWANVTLNVFFPKLCLACAKKMQEPRGRSICSDCLKKFHPVKYPFCERCGTELSDGGALCFSCRKPSKFYCDFIRSAARFEDPLRTLIHKLKYTATSDFIAEEISFLLLDAWMKFPEFSQTTVMTCVPLHASRKRERGYNQSELLARALYRTLKQSEAKIQFAPQLLKRVRRTPPQTHLSRTERMKNLEGAFTCLQPQSVRGQSILVIDDVATTAATLQECAKTLKNAGAQQVFALTIARD